MYPYNYNSLFKTMIPLIIKVINLVQLYSSRFFINTVTDDGEYTSSVKVTKYS